MESLSKECLFPWLKVIPKLEGPKFLDYFCLIGVDRATKQSN